MNPWTWFRKNFLTHRGSQGKELRADIPTTDANGSEAVDIERSARRS